MIVKGITDMLTDVQIARQAKMLPITEVASRVGYKSYQGFYQAYQQAMNMSPADYVAKSG